MPRPGYISGRMRLLASAILCGLSLHAQARITGTVIDAVTGEPISGAVVAARVEGEDVDSNGFHRRGPDLIHPSRTLTDDAGRFAFDADSTLVSAHLSISHPGYRSEDSSDAASITVRPSERAGIRVKLIPVSVLHGLVSDTSGDPLSGISVQAVRVEIRDGRQVRTPFASKDTNESGEYRFDGLPAGAYFLRATGAPADDGAYGPVYFPVAPNPDSAQALRVAPGKAVVADFTLSRRHTYRIRGIVTNPPPRRPLAMRLLLGDDALGNTAAVSPNGTFEMTNVAPGTYLLQAYTPNSTPPDFGETTITIGDHDSVGVKIALTTGVDVFGHVEFRGPSGSEHFAQVHAAGVNVRRWPVNVADSSVVINDRGNFTLKNLLPGQYDIAVRGLPDFYVSEISAGGTDVLLDGLTIGANNAPRLSIVMQVGGGQIEGIVEGGSSANFVVALIARYGSVRVPTMVHAVQGRFHAAGLTPGQYVLYAWPETRAVEYRNPWVLDELSAYAVSVAVRDGGTHAVTVKPIP